MQKKVNKKRLFSQQNACAVKVRKAQMQFKAYQISMRNFKAGGWCADLYIFYK